MTAGAANVIVPAAAVVVRNFRRDIIAAESRFMVKVLDARADTVRPREVLEIVLNRSRSRLPGGEVRTTLGWPSLGRV